MKDGKLLALILAAVVVIALIAMASAKAGKDCEAKGGSWEKNPGSTKTGYHCVMPK